MVALKSTMRHLESCHAVRSDLLRSFAKSKGLCLSKEISHQQIVVPSQQIQRLAEADKIARDQFGSLVNELIEGMLPIRARLPPDNRASLIIDRMTLQIHMLAIALHVELLQVCR